jgi:hypothetical protein
MPPGPQASIAGPALDSISSPTWTRCGENETAAQRDWKVQADVWPGWHGPGAGPSELRFLASAGDTLAASAMSATNATHNPLRTTPIIDPIAPQSLIRDIGFLPYRSAGSTAMGNPLRRGVGDLT